MASSARAAKRKAEQELGESSSKFGRTSAPGRPSRARYERWGDAHRVPPVRGNLRQTAAAVSSCLDEAIIKSSVIEVLDDQFSDDENGAEECTAVVGILVWPSGCLIKCTFTLEFSTQTRI